MHLRYLPTSLLLLLGILPAAAQPNFSEHISPIIYQHCTSCHRPGEVGPMPFTSYAEVSAWGPMIAYVTQIRYMPPWQPDPSYSHFVGENTLAEQEISLIRDWVQAGSPQGNPALEAPLPEFATGSQLGTPDLVVSFAQSYTHPGNNADEYRVFVLPTGTTQDHDLAAVEFRPGNKRIVHHALIAWDTTGQAQALDDADPVYGYESFGGFGVENASRNQYQGYVPGQISRRFLDGMGQQLYAGADLLVQMHYAPTAVNEADSSSINLFFADAPVQRYIQNYIMLPLPGVLTNGPFLIPPGQVRSFHGQITVPADVSLVAISPHMHLLGQSWEVYAVPPAGDTIPLIRIPQWDFNWQGTYQFDRLIKIPAGSVIHATAAYDNTVNNPLNPNSPPQWVSWGERTQDEMYYLPITFVEYWPGDEFVMLTNNDDPAGLVRPETRLYPVYPNPASTVLKAGFSLSEPGQVSLRLYDLQGRELMRADPQRHFPVGHHLETLNAAALPEGLYLLQLSVDGRAAGMQKVLVSGRP